MYEIEDESKEKKEKHLIKFNKKSNVIHTVVAVLATTLISIYLYYTVRQTKDYTS